MSSKRPLDAAGGTKEDNVAKRIPPWPGVDSFAPLRKMFPGVNFHNSLVLLPLPPLDAPRKEKLSDSLACDDMAEIVRRHGAVVRKVNEQAGIMLHAVSCGAEIDRALWGLYRDARAEEEAVFAKLVTAHAHRCAASRPDSVPVQIVAEAAHQKPYSSSHFARNVYSSLREAGGDDENTRPPSEDDVPRERLWAKFLATRVAKDDGEEGKTNQELILATSFGQKYGVNHVIYDRLPSLMRVHSDAAQDLHDGDVTMALLVNPCRYATKTEPALIVNATLSAFTIQSLASYFPKAVLEYAELSRRR